jgi:phage shock protein PspC (stress-responsive transcriptional regulator)
MKETIKINLNQRLFDLDSDAYERLKKYLDSLKKYFQKSSKEAEEILQDIEQRMADLFEEKQTDKKQIITAEDVDEVIKMMGTIEDFEFESETSENETSSGHQEKDQASDPYQKENRRLHRDIDNNLLGGVCSGIAAYFNVDIVWIRLAFVLLFLLKGAGLIAYIILWIVVPAARTTTQKLQMKGRPVNIENIEQSVKEEYNKVKENVRNYSKSESFRRMQYTAGEVFSTLGSVFLVILKVILVIIGISFAMAGIFLILGLLAIVPFSNLPHSTFQNMPFWDHLSPFMHNIPLFTFALAVVILVPLIGIIVSSIRAVFNIKKRNNILSAFSWTIWSLAFVFIIVTIISGEMVLSREEKIEDETILKVPRDKSLIIAMDEASFTSVPMAHYNILGIDILHNEDKDRCYVRPNFIISNSADSLFYLEIIRSSSFSFSGHDSHFYNDDYNWKLNDSVLNLDEYYIIDDNQAWTLPRIDVKLRVPTGKKVIMKGDAGRLFERRESDNKVLSDKEIKF